MKMKSQVRAALLLPVLTLMFCLSVGQAHAQTAPVTLRVSDVPLEQVLNQIEKQTSYLFVYDKNVDVARKVSVAVSATPLKSVLATLLQPAGIAYAVENTSIVLTQKSSESQKPAAVKGVVTDAAGQPIIGAAVVVKGTTIGTSTGVDGSFSLQVPSPAASAVLTVNYLGYQTTEIAVGSRTDFQIALKEDAVNVDAVVVTALGIKRSEKALSYNVQQVNQDDIVGVKDVNFINALSGKVAGVNINASSSGVGGASKVVMRGSKAISQSNNALYVVDGMPMYTLGRDNSSDSEFASTGNTEPIADINPEDIESLTVLTGAAAAALYGSNASNGAIIITTKKGKAGITSVTVTSNTEVSSPFVLPRFQNRYGTGSLLGSSSEEFSWGKRLNASNHMGYDPRKDFMQNGIVGTETVSLSTGTERNQTYLSAGAVNSRGIIPNNGYDRYNLTFRNTSSFLKDRMTLDLGASYIKQSDQNMTNQGTYSNPLTAAYLFPRGNDWEDVKMFERYDPERNIYTQYWPHKESTLMPDNPYWTVNRNLRENRRDRYMLNAGLSYKIVDWLTASGRIRIDNSVNEFEEKLYASTSTTLTDGSKNGLYNTQTINDKQTYGDALLDINKQLGDNWSLHANIGGSFSDLRQKTNQVRGPIREDGIPNLFNVMQLDDAKTQRLQGGWHEQTQSVFASAEIGFKNAYYLTVTGRNDWASQLAGPHSVKSSFFYPSVGLSVVLSEVIRMPKQISYLKIRGSFASVGLPFSRFLANPTYSWNNSNKNWEIETNYPLYDLKPERTDSWEVGLTMRFLKHFNLDVSYYDTKTFNQTFDSQLSATGGYSKFYVQSGSVRNQGVELALGYKNTWRNFTWSSNYTLSSNHNRILELMDVYVHPISGEEMSLNRLDVGKLGDAHFLLKPGGSLGDLYSQVDLQRDSNGHIYIDQNGDLNTNTKAGDLKLGSVFPKANMSWRNDFSWRNLNFGFLVSARLGGIVYSATQAILDRYGVSEASAAARDAGGVRVEGNVIPAQKWFAGIGRNTGIPQYYTYDATNVRLQEVSIGYTIPRQKLGDVVQITVSVVGRNLWMIYNKAPFDPEAVARTGNYYQGLDYFMMPSLRNIGFNVRLNF